MPYVYIIYDIVRTYVCMYILCMHVRIICLYVLYVRMCECMYVYTYVCMYICMYACTYMYVCTVCMYVSMYVHMYVSTYPYVQMCRFLRLTTFSMMVV